MKYLILLRGVNVGGKGTISMKLLKEVLIKEGLQDVSTYINSGNVIVTSNKSTEELEKKIESILSKDFFPIDTVVVSAAHLKQIVEDIPDKWKKDDVRKYIAFLKSPATPKELVEQANPKENIDFVDVGKRVVYLSTKMEGLTKSNFTKLITKPIYKKMTMRNFNTVEKILALMG